MRNIAYSILIGFSLLAFGYCRGRADQHEEEMVLQSRQKIAAQDSIVSADSAKADTAVKRADTTRALHRLVRAKVQVSEDTVRVLGKVEQHGDTAVVIAKDLSSLITVTDAQNVVDPLALKALQLEIADLKKTIALRDEHIKLLESQKPGRLDKLITAAKWLTLGAAIGVVISK